MNKQRGTTITIVAAVLALCCSLLCCTSGGGMFAGGEELGRELVGAPIAPVYGTLPCCLGILVLIIPLLLWIFLVRGAKDETYIEGAYVEGAIVEEADVEQAPVKEIETMDTVAEETTFAD